jgi:hypothetical protein
MSPQVAAPVNCLPPVGLPGLAGDYSRLFSKRYAAGEVIRAAAEGSYLDRRDAAAIFWAAASRPPVWRGGRRAAWCLVAFWWCLSLNLEAPNFSASLSRRYVDLEIEGPKSAW